MLDQAKRMTIKIISICLLIIIWSFSSLAIEVPSLKGRVNDYAGLLSPETIATLENQLSKLEKEDSTQIVILTIPSLEGLPIEDFAVKVFNSWGVGQKKLDNGVLLIIALKERRVRIEVGRGLEGKLTDVISSRIIREDIKPLLSKNDFNAGIIKGIESITEFVKEEYTSSSDSEFNILRSRVERFMCFTLFVFTTLLTAYSYIPEKISRKHRVIYGMISSVITIAASYLWITDNLVKLSLIGVGGFVLGYLATYLRYFNIGPNFSPSGSSSVFPNINDPLGHGDFSGGHSFLGSGDFSGGGGSSGGGGASDNF
jgi:uncharacterized protein